MMETARDYGAIRPRLVSVPNPISKSQPDVSQDFLNPAPLSFQHHNDESMVKGLIEIKHC